MHAQRSSLTAFAATLLLAACGSKGPGDVNTLGGTVRGLTASGLVLRLNESHEVAVPAGATDFQFGSFEEGAAYDVRVKAQPDGQTCTVSGGQGTMAGASVQIEVTCSEEAHAVGGAVSGLASGETVTLALNGEPYIVSATGAYTFPGSIPYGATYSVIVVAAPAGKRCEIAHAGDTMAHAAVADVNVACAACGNQIIEEGEECDDGPDNGITRCPYGAATCKACTLSCKEVALTGPFCGDGFVTTVAEQCDDPRSVACGTCGAPGGATACMARATAAAAGSITIKGADLAGIAFTLDDGVGAPVTFEFVRSGGSAAAGRVPISFDGLATLGISRNVADAINARGLRIVASTSQEIVRLTSTTRGVAGNRAVTISGATLTSIGVTGMSGGAGCATGMACAANIDCVLGYCDAGVCR